MKGSRTKTCVHVDLLLCVLLFAAGRLMVCRGQITDSSISPMEKEEQEMLYSAIQGFVGESWNGSDLYPDPCGWTPVQGVSCDLYDGLWYISSINIGPVMDNSLKCARNAKFTHHLFKLKHLKSLSFFNCFFSRTHNPTRIPTSDWDKLSNSLQSLEFRSNPGLIGTIPLSIGHLKQLQSLVLVENGLTGKLPMELGSLINLKRLVLARNQFSDRIPESFGALSELLIFDSSMNLLSGSLPLTIGGLTSLLKLDLGNNKLEGKIPEEIGRLKNLILLDLRGNNFSGGMVQSLQEMVSLKEMVMSNNPKLGDDLMGIEWKKLQNLEILDLSGIGLIGTIPDSITEIKRLRFLGLNDNNLSGSVSSCMEKMLNIGALYLNGNNFSGILEFSGRFYGRMGRRFGAWNNPNLCYKVESESSSTSHFPSGVKPCFQETSISHAVSNSRIGEGNLNQNSLLEASLGHLSFSLCGFWWAFVVVQGLICFLLYNIFF
ncbi:piriformospora indica-insensitive protein 2-like isoform X1 [Ricinus communis]|uniref:piriformospora indica-insensitive protein 2-like isoform X1 n=1 Tax=Ricinus communis TaxID=3988 RepID=UPI00201AF4FA|nr:piriformospora indica-insensitive protein 2-like isoform X1 [Ricinus communis]XP_048227185.1 piriformospora indica-insensitive protein 2-like isoform X1 [Ricinus communis]XP_048227187.1 piriformospora indica-insensitive protein 2-like isoform X1 [Ricinus communis]